MLMYKVKGRRFAKGDREATSHIVSADSRNSSFYCSTSDIRFRPLNTGLLGLYSVISTYPFVFFNQNTI